MDFLQVEKMRPTVVAGSNDRPNQRGNDADFQQRKKQPMALLVALLCEWLHSAAQLFAGFGLGHSSGLQHFAQKSDTQSS